MYDSVTIEDRGKPAVALVNRSFVLNGKFAAAGEGMPGLRIVPETIPCECSVDEQVQAGVHAAMDAIVDGLTRPLTPQEKSPEARPARKLPRTAFSGNLEEVNRFCYRMGWTDGLPIVPPTEAAVAEMLTGTDLPPDHVVGRLLPHSNRATVEKIAINAVMAGALPTYMPVLIATVQALMEPAANFFTFESSTGSFAPFWIVNGPARRALNVNCGTAALSPGDIANAAIGRAIGFIVRNIGGSRKGMEDTGTLGNPAKYGMVIAENEEESPWEPLHVENGLEPADSAVSLFFTNCWAQPFAYGTDDRGILSAVVYNVLPVQRGLFCLVLPPEQARTLAERGWTKPQLKTYISEYARVPAYRHMSYSGTTPGVPAKEWLPMNPTDSMRMLRNPDWIRIIVAGGPGVVLGLFMGVAPGGEQWVTKKLELPARWDELVAKYGDVVPRYAAGP